MKTIRLKAEYDYDFQLLGLISKAKEYTLSWAINKNLDISLKKEDDIQIILKNEKELKVSNYSYRTDTSSLFLIKNKLEEEIDGEQAIFAPSLKTFDYLLKIESDDSISSLDDIFNSIRSVNQIQSVLKLDVKKIKEKEYFLL
ncbi:MAG: IPExxxVDY family protein [Cyclobacteriaceae bacterium]